MTGALTFGHSVSVSTRSPKERFRGRLVRRWSRRRNLGTNWRRTARKRVVGTRSLRRAEDTHRGGPRSRSTHIRRPDVRRRLRSSLSNQDTVLGPVIDRHGHRISLAWPRVRAKLSVVRRKTRPATKEQRKTCLFTRICLASSVLDHLYLHYESRRASNHARHVRPLACAEPRRPIRRTTDERAFPHRGSHSVGHDIASGECRVLTVFGRRIDGRSNRDIAGHDRVKRTRQSDG